MDNNNLYSVAKIKGLRNRGAPMRVLIAMCALLFPIFAAGQDLGPYAITGGEIAGCCANLQGSITGNGFTGTFVGYPLSLYGGGVIVFWGGDIDFSILDFLPPPGRDQGGYISISGPSDLAQEGLVPVHYPGLYSPYIQESGVLTTPVMNVTSPGTYSVPFTLSLTVGYGAPNTTVPQQYVDFLGVGTFSATFESDVACGLLVCPLFITYVDYSFQAAPALLATLLTEVTGVGPGRSLADNMSLVQTYYLVNDIPNTCSQLTAFVNKVNAQNGKKIAPQLDAKLVADAQAMETAISCP